MSRPIDWLDTAGWGKGENVHESATGSELEAEEADE